MTEQLSYREATIDDIQQLKSLGLKSYGQYAPELTDENLDKMTCGIGNDDTWQNILNTGKGFVCTVNDSVVGMAFLIPSGNPWDIFKPEWSYIRMLGVDPDYQGRGVARTLMHQCIAYAKKNNERTVALHTSEKMHGARHIYESLGFKVLCEIPERLGWRYWLYTLDL